MKNEKITGHWILTFQQSFQEQNFFLHSDHPPLRSVGDQVACAPQVVWMHLAACSRLGLIVPYPYFLTFCSGCLLTSPRTRSFSVLQLCPVGDTELPPLPHRTVEGSCQKWSYPFSRNTHYQNGRFREGTSLYIEFHRIFPKLAIAHRPQMKDVRHWPTARKSHHEHPQSLRSHKWDPAYELKARNASIDNRSVRTGAFVVTHFWSRDKIHIVRLLLTFFRVPRWFAIEGSWNYTFCHLSILSW